MGSRHRTLNVWCCCDGTVLDVVTIRKGFFWPSLLERFCFVSTLFPFAFFDLLLSLLPTRNSDPGSHSSPPPPLPTTFCAFIYIAGRLQSFLPSSTPVSNQYYFIARVVAMRGCHVYYTSARERGKMRTTRMTSRDVLVTETSP